MMLGLILQNYQPNQKTFWGLTQNWLKMGHITPLTSLTSLFEKSVLNHNLPAD